MKKIMIPLNYFIISLTAILIFLNLKISSQVVHSDTLPKPTGTYFVGVTYLNFTDDSRIETFDNNHEKRREITVKAWYPADYITDPEPYLLNNEADFAIKYLQFPPSYSKIVTNSSRDVGLSTRENKYPILIFSHGLGEHYSQNSILMEELASHGYIIFSISHHYECKFSSFPDGRLIYIDMNSLRLQDIMQEMQSAEAIELLQKMHHAENDKERRNFLIKQSEALPVTLTESPQYWATDISFFIDQLDDINNENKILRDKLNLDRIGVFGMSLGGLASCEVCLSDERIKACINMDGGLNNSMLDKQIQVPVLFLNSKRYLGYGELFTSFSSADSYSICIRDSDHYNLSDYTVYPVPAIKSLLGTIDTGIIIEIMNVTVLAFFEEYLKEKQGIDLLGRINKYSEIEIVTKI